MYQRNPYVTDLLLNDPPWQTAEDESDRRAVAVGPRHVRCFSSHSLQLPYPFVDMMIWLLPCTVQHFTVMNVNEFLNNRAFIICVSSCFISNLTLSFSGLKMSHCLSALLALHGFHTHFITLHRVTQIDPCCAAPSNFTWLNDNKSISKNTSNIDTAHKASKRPFVSEGLQSQKALEDLTSFYCID